MKTNSTSAIMLVLFLMCFINSSVAQSSFADYRNSYKPNNHLFSPDNEIVYSVKSLEKAKSVTVLENYIKNNNLTDFCLIITSIERTEAGRIIDAMQPEIALKGLKHLSDKWVLEISYYVSEKTFNMISQKIAVLQNYNAVSLK